MKLEKILLLLFFSLSNLIHLSAQFSGIGFSGGGTASSFEYGDQVNSVQDFEEQSALGATAGIQFDFDLGSENTKLSPEFFFIQNGAKEFYSINGLSADLINRNVNLDYVGLYLPLQLYFPFTNTLHSNSGGYHGINFNFSGFIDYAIKGEIENDKGQLEDITFDRSFDKVDLGAAASMGFWNNGLGITLGYNYGLKNIEFNEALGNSTEEDNYLINNRGFTLSIGYRTEL